MSDRPASQSTGWDEAFDIVIVGCGAAGMTAGIIAARRGLKPLIIEKAAVWGGTSALSAGGIWVAANPLMAKGGREDSKEEAIKFLNGVVPREGLATSLERQTALVENGTRAMDELVDAGMQWAADIDHPDYLSEAPHAKIGRGLDSKVFDGKKLGPWLKTMRRSTLAPFALQVADLPIMGRGDMGHILRVVFRHYIRKLVGQEPLGMGESLVAQLMTIVQRNGVPVRLETSLEDIVFEAGRAAGVVVRSKGVTRRIGANAAVILCAGGFAHDEALRRRLHKVSGSMSGASPDDTGDVVKMADGIGAMTEMGEDAWWTTAFVLPDGSPALSHGERTLPFGICVGADGKRFANESSDYYHFARAIAQRGPDEPVWLVFEARHRQRYPILGAPPGVTPPALIDSGVLKTAGDLSELARKCGIDEAGLRATVDRFNAFARTGIDEDFHRGEGKYDRHWSDPKQKPNPNLGPIERAPFYATRVYAGDLGTKGGYVTDANAQVLDRDGKPMAALYASGNVTASVMGSEYPGPGVTLGPAMTFAYIAVEHAARRRTNA
jgi:3-oxosteroid 1-dehydrogenase